MLYSSNFGRAADVEDGSNLSPCFSFRRSPRSTARLASFSSAATGSKISPSLNPARTLLTLRSRFPAGCTAPIGADRVTTRQAYDQVEANALRTGKPSAKPSRSCTASIWISWPPASRTKPCANCTRKP